MTYISIGFRICSIVNVNNFKNLNMNIINRTNNNLMFDDFIFDDNDRDANWDAVWESEVTIDEIGIINDYIQERAGNNVNIIMGIGEDSNLIDEISVTVIATGFDISLQDEIIHVDPKKKIHYLDEESEVVEKFEDKALTEQNNAFLTAWLGEESEDEEKKND